MLFLKVLFLLILAHIIADFPLQTDWVFKLKSKHVAGIGLHAAIHAAVTLILLSSWTKAHIWGFVAVVATTHFVCDWCKVAYCPQNTLLAFLLDQAIHLLILLVVAYLIPKPLAAPPLWILYPALACGIMATPKIIDILLQRHVQINLPLKGSLIL